MIEPLAGDGIRVEFRRPQRAVAPGQSVVVYLGDELLGGGRIVEALR
ncbi:MAG: aminomethyltransferase beta-barrel domain-containing protein [Actinomycetota bacterium]